MISQESDDLIIASEVGSKALYEKKFKRPEWPGGGSGVTIAMGYDLGFASHAKIDSDWGALVPGSMVDAMRSVSGLTGSDAASALSSVKNRISIEWDQAVHVYETVDIPQWEARVCRAVPGADKLHPHSRGALTSLAYNRGASFQLAGDRYREMRAIRSHVMSGNLDLVDDEIRNMKRIWEGKGLPGLLVRRDKEAALWNRGLEAVKLGLPAPKADKVINPIPKPLVEPKAAGGAIEATAGAAGSSAAAAEATRQGMPPDLAMWLFAAGVVVTIGTVMWLRYRRQQPVLARTKDAPGDVLLVA